MEVISGEMHLLRSMTTKPKNPDANDVPTVRTLLYNIQKLLEAKAKQDGTQFAPLISKEIEI